MAQLLNAVKYLHTGAENLHNDITTTNILLGPDVNSDQCTSANSGNYQIILIYFGKATKSKCGKCFIYLFKIDWNIREISTNCSRDS